MKTSQYTLVLLLVSSCLLKGASPLHSVKAPGLPLELGDIEFNAEPEDCEGAKCYSFTTTSRVGESSKPGILSIREPEGVVRGTVAFYSGGTGTKFGGTDQMTNDCLAAGYRTIHVKWDTGWLVGAPGAYEGFRKLAVHPATSADFIKRNFSESDKPFVLWGSSGGALQIAFMLSFYGIDKITDTAIISGGFHSGRVDIGSLDEDPLNAHLHYPEVAGGARAFADLGFGFDENTPGPCELKDENFADLMKESSVAFGGHYNHPDTVIYLLYGAKNRMARHHGLLYYEQLVAHDSPHLHMQVIDDVRHGVHWDPKGYEITKKILLAQLSRTEHTLKVEEIK